MNKNEKTFRLVNKKSQTFSIIVANFQYAATLLFRIRDRIRLTIVSSAIMKFVSVISEGKLRIVTQTKLRVSPIQSINAKRISIVSVLRQRLKAVSVIRQLHPMSFVSKAVQKVISIIKQGKLTISAVPLLVILLTLGYFDTSTLLSLDSLTLEDMDYTVV